MNACMQKTVSMGAMSVRPSAVRPAKAASVQPRSVMVRAEGEEKPIHLRSTAFKPVMDIDEIMKILPHRCVQVD